MGLGRGKCISRRGSVKGKEELKYVLLKEKRFPRAPHFVLGPKMYEEVTILRFTGSNNLRTLHE